MFPLPTDHQHGFYTAIMGGLVVGCSQYVSLFTLGERILIRNKSRCLSECHLRCDFLLQDFLQPRTEVSRLYLDVLV